MKVAGAEVLSSCDIQARLLDESVALASATSEQQQAERPVVWCACNVRQVTCNLNQNIG